MVSALDELRKHVPVPQQPTFAAGDWSAVEGSLGTSLPSDYKAFVSTYGAGTILSEHALGSAGLVIHSPFVWAADRRDVRKAWIDWASMYHDFAKYGGADIPYPVFPDAEGLLPFGSLADSNTMNWLTLGNPDGWLFVYYDRDDGFMEVKGISAVEFMLEVVTRRSPLMVRTGSDTLFEPPLKFERFVGL
jgi:hypothetical protein